MISSVCNEKEWTTYVGVMIKSKIHGMELVARMVGQNDVGDENSQSLTLLEAIDEQGIECVIVFMQPSQKSQDDTEADDPPLLEVMKQC
jgi:hypothetical protein